MHIHDKDAMRLITANMRCEPIKSEEQQEPIIMISEVAKSSVSIRNIMQLISAAVFQAIMIKKPSD